MERTIKMCTLTLMAVSILSCVPQATTVKKVDGYRVLMLDGKEYSERNIGPLTTWICKDFLKDDIVVLEVGFSNNPISKGMGFILFDGGYSGEMASYKRDGLNHRWDWGPNKNDYAFIITTSSLGLYYDFTIATQTKASGVFKCYRR